MQHVEIRPKAYPIAIELLAAEREKLLLDHFDEAPAWWARRETFPTSCAGCIRATAIRAELEDLGDIRLEVD